MLDQPARPDPQYDAHAPDPATSDAPYRIYNIGNHQAVTLLDYIATLERVLGRSTAKNLLPMQPGDVASTYAATDRIRAAVGFSPSTPLEEGLRSFAAWFRHYYKYD